MKSLPQIEKGSCCEVEAIVSFDDRGQVVIPKDVRKKYNLNAGDKLALVSCTNSAGELCCFTLIKSNQLDSRVKEVLQQFLIKLMQNNFL